MQATTIRPKITVTADGRGVASPAGSGLLADLGSMTGLDRGFADAVGGRRQRRSAHDPGRVLADLAVLLADGGETISDLGVLRDQPDLSGQVASTATAWRVLESIGESGLGRLRTARAAARERAWLARADLGRDIPVLRAGGRAWPGLVIDLDATLVIAHSDKELARPSFKGGYGYHPLLAFPGNTSEALAGILRPGNAGSDTAADHIHLTRLALAQIPDHETPRPAHPDPRRRCRRVQGMAGPLASAADRGGP